MVSIACYPTVAMLTYPTLPVHCFPAHIPVHCVCCCRYSHSGPLLWPKAQAPQPRPCPSCGGPRVFEVQLMPALSQMVLEAAGMAQDQGLAVDADGEWPIQD